MTPELKNAIWAGDMDKVHALAPCRCCCVDHTFDDCLARAAGVCRGQGEPTFAERRSDEASWARHYKEHHGIELFSGSPVQPEST